MCVCVCVCVCVCERERERERKGGRMGGESEEGYGVRGERVKKTDEHAER